MYNRKHDIFHCLFVFMFILILCVPIFVGGNTCNLEFYYYLYSSNTERVPIYNLFESMRTHLRKK